MRTRAIRIRTVIALVVGIALTVVCYFFVDRPVAWFVHDHRFYPREMLQWPPLFSEWLKIVALVAMILVIPWCAWKPGGRFQTVLLAISVNLVVTAVIKKLLKWGCGRNWPESWEAGKPSLIGSGAYGFHPFHHGDAYQSFPSGHAAMVCSVLAILWLSYPRWRGWYAVAGGAVCVGLVAMNYHFVSDVIAGAMLGSITGVCMGHVFRIRGTRTDIETLEKR
jgi:membrane-associated phospholipid phosphatase